MLSSIAPRKPGQKPGAAGTEMFEGAPLAGGEVPEGAFPDGGAPEGPTPEGGAPGDGISGVPEGDVPGGVPKGGVPVVPGKEPGCGLRWAPGSVPDGPVAVGPWACGRRGCRSRSGGAARCHKMRASSPRIANTAGIPTGIRNSRRKHRLRPPHRRAGSLGRGADAATAGVCGGEGSAASCCGGDGTLNAEGVA